MAETEQLKKRIAVFDPEERSRAVILPMLTGLGYEVDEHHTRTRIADSLAGKHRADGIFLHLAVFGDTYAQVTEGLESLDLPGRTDAPPILAISVLKLSEEAQARLERLGCTVVLSRHVPLLEVMFAINRLLFPKIRELRRYTRVFGGFPVQFSAGDDWQEGQVYNLSREGAFIQCDDPPAERTRIRVRFVLPGLDEPLQVDTIVSWVNGADRENDPLSPPGMGINFLAMSSEANDSLDRFISARE